MATYMLDLTGKKAAFRKIKVKKNEEKNVKDNVKGGNKDSYFKTGGFSDGVNGVGDFFGDLGQTVLGTAGDIAVGMLKGVTRTAENLGDLTGYLGGTARPYNLGDMSYKLNKEDLVANLTDEMWKPAVDYVDQYSVLGNKADSISEGLGQVATTILAGAAGGAAGLGTAGVTALTTGLVGTSAVYINRTCSHTTSKTGLAFCEIRGTIEKTGTQYKGVLIITAQADMIAGGNMYDYYANY